MNIRLANINDAQCLKGLYAQLNPNDPTLSLKAFVEKLSFIINASHLTLFVVELDQKVIATCYLNVIENLSRNLKSYAILENVVTHEHFRGQGVGKAVVKHAIQYAFVEMGCYKIMLQTGSKRESTLKFYQSCGFKGDVKTAFVANNGI